MDSGGVPEWIPVWVYRERMNSHTEPMCPCEDPRLSAHTQSFPTTAPPQTADPNENAQR